MKYLKTFESHNSDISTQIAEDLLPKLQKLRRHHGHKKIEVTMAETLKLEFRTFITCCYF